MIQYMLQCWYQIDRRFQFIRGAVHIFKKRKLQVQFRGSLLISQPRTKSYLGVRGVVNMQKNLKGQVQGLGLGVVVYMMENDIEDVVVLVLNQFYIYRNSFLKQAFLYLSIGSVVCQKQYTMIDIICQFEFIFLFCTYLWHQTIFFEYFKKGKIVQNILEILLLYVLWRGFSGNYVNTYLVAQNYCTRRQQCKSRFLFSFCLLVEWQQNFEYWMKNLSNLNKIFVSVLFFNRICEIQRQVSYRLSSSEVKFRQIGEISPKIKTMVQIIIVN
eukprot:TRINITY_DN14392_c0_g1_i6.p1 TRINITY_DN14392_c0_g1~~TRINITY_DN14392_c0_g1_i6.p1  ORF type:complete len:271 (-),score=3.24 TRINITY_DN14392_c0_g1_i6:312-1124(-)